jgi:hypothetical protein
VLTLGMCCCVWRQVSPELLRDCLVKLNNNYSHHAQASVLAEGCSLSSKWPLQG